MRPGAQRPSGSGPRPAPSGKPCTWTSRESIFVRARSPGADESSGTASSERRRGSRPGGSERCRESSRFRESRSEATQGRLPSAPVWRTTASNFEKQTFVSPDRPQDIRRRAGLQGASAFAEGGRGVRCFAQAILSRSPRQVNLDRYLPPPRRNRRPARRRRERSSTKPEEPIDLSALKGLNLKAT